MTGRTAQWQALLIRYALAKACGYDTPMQCLADKIRAAQARYVEARARYECQRAQEKDQHWYHFKTATNPSLAQWQRRALVPQRYWRYIKGPKK